MVIDNKQTRLCPFLKYGSKTIFFVGINFQTETLDPLVPAQEIGPEHPVALDQVLDELRK